MQFKDYYQVLGVARDATTLVLVPGVLGSGFRELDQKANVAVGRYRYDLNEHASIGAIGTFRAGDDYANNVAGVDARQLCFDLCAHQRLHRHFLLVQQTAVGAARRRARPRAAGREAEAGGHGQGRAVRLPPAIRQAFQ